MISPYLVHHVSTDSTVSCFALKREEVLASRKRRSEQLEKLLTDAKERYADHTNGVRLLTEEEMLKLEKKIEVFTKKLDTMKVEPDEREIKRMIERERLIKERQKERAAYRSSEL